MNKMGKGDGVLENGLKSDEEHLNANVEGAAELGKGSNGIHASSDDSDVTPTSLRRTDDGFSPASSSPTAALIGRVDTNRVTLVDDYNPTMTPTEDHEMAATHLGQGSYRVYPKRWLMLCVVSLLNCSNTWSWIGYAPVSNFVDCYYGKSTATWLSAVFLIAAVPVGFVAMWAVRRYGLRFSILIAAWTNGIGAVIRLVSSGLPYSASRYVVLLGQLSAAVAYPFIMFLPTKVAAAWFADSQRPTATMIAAMSNPLGVMLANLISPQLVVQKSDVIYLNILLSIACLATVLLATVGVRTSDPPSPPGLAAAQEALPFWPGVKRCMTSKAFLTLVLALGAGIGMFNALYSMMQQILCSRGYSNSFSGFCCVLMIVGGICGATVSAKIVSRTKRFEETIKISFGLAVICGVCFSLVALQQDLKPLIAIICALFGFFGLAAYPTSLEMGAECTFPAAETTSTGLMVLSGQIQGVLYILLMEFLGKPLTNPAALEREACSVGGGHGGECGPSAVQAKDMTVAMLVFASIAALMACIFIPFFHPRLKRTMLEATGKAASSKKTGGKVIVGGDQAGASGTTSPLGAVEMKVIKKGTNGAALSNEPLTAEA